MIKEYFELFDLFLCGSKVMSESLKHLIFYGSTFVRVNNDKTKINFDLNSKSKYPLMIALLIEFIKNVVLVLIPSDNDIRYFV